MEHRWNKGNNWQGRTELLGQSLFQCHCPPISHGPTLNQNWFSAVKGQRLTTKAMERPSKDKTSLPYIKIYPVLRSKYTARLLMKIVTVTWRKKTALYPEIHTKHVNTLCGQNVDFLNVTHGGIYNYIESITEFNFRSLITYQKTSEWIDCYHTLRPFIARHTAKCTTF